MSEIEILTTERDNALLERDTARDAVAAMTVEIADLRAKVEHLTAYVALTAALNPVVTADVGERSAVTTAGDAAERLIDSILRDPE